MIDSILGVDIGSVSVGLALMGSDRRILHADYRFHGGMIRETLEQVLAELPQGIPATVACTSSTPELLTGCLSFDSRVCYVDAARETHPRLGSLLLVGGEKFAALRFDSEGSFLNLRASTSCAAGTGSFLDQQARRLGLRGSAELAELALANRGTAPGIASRCAVFAKTDLCHAQQAGYGLEEICDGLCRGLARNIADTISGGDPLPQPVFLAGGVSRNPAVIRHLEKLLACRIHTSPDAHLFGAIGACLNALAQREVGPDCGGPDCGGPACGRPGDAGIRLRPPDAGGRSYQNPPLVLHLSQFPEFESQTGTLFRPSAVNTEIPVEIDLYASPASGSRAQAILGIDVGSTSTKAVLLAPDRTVLAGFYTRTAGRPLVAVQALFEALEHVRAVGRWELEILGAATTGAGRSFIGRVLGADLILNEITAHARAAWELEPGIDTIIEIGGQDAKFTTVREGRVTFSQMNTVCAAGTGSFIEEQAARLGVPLSEYSRRAEGVRSPLASDRCTVFMERDINHYLNQKYTVDEILAAVLYSVRENYLLKVASEGLIGEKICFQGATAKNRALVAAFEEKLGKPIFVSRYCHLTGALGAALSLQDQRGARPGATAFRGIGLYRAAIPVRAETCDLCPNHCRLRVAEVQGETVAYGFLCGRDYDVRRFVSRNTSGFDLLREVRRLRRAAERPPEGEAPVRGSGPSGDPGRRWGGLPAGTRDARRDALRVGIPAALHLYAELPLWKRFFRELGIPTVTSENCTDALARGKEVSGAEFCAPVAALHGHVRWLLDGSPGGGGCDRVFLPVTLEAPREAASHPSRRDRETGLRYYCYYTQFAPSVVASVPEAAPDGTCLMPLVDHGAFEPFGVGERTLPGGLSREARRARRRTAAELLRALAEVAPGLTLGEVSRAYARAVTAFARLREGFRELYRDEPGREGDVRVVLTGRPYLILEPSMNKGIPDIFAARGVRAYYQDMIPVVGEARSEIGPLLDAFHWHYAARILQTAEACLRIEGLYPVLVTAFKCSPDSFVIEYFKRLLDAHGKPYLILQIDEHDSSVGYETRIEAGIHSFRNHYRGGTAAPSASRPSRPAAAASVAPEIEGSLRDKILLFPHLDPLTSPLVVAHLQRAGIDARLLEETPLSIATGMRLNTGQCIPISVITQETVDYVRTHGLDPARVVLWMGRSNWSCGVHMYPYYIKSLLETQGLGQVGVYVGEISHFELSPALVIGTYFAYLFGGLLRRLGCRIRPYELHAGDTDRVTAECRDLLAEAFRGERSRLRALREVIRRFEAIPTAGEGRRPGGGKPKVAIFGDLYVRDNDVMNQDLVHAIEAAGGEVVTTPYSEYMRIIAEAYFEQWRKQGLVLELLKNKALLAAVKLAERRFLSLYRGYVSPPDSYRHPDVEKELGLFNLPLELSGESYDNVLKILHLLRLHPDISLFVQTNPAFCCPSLVTEGMTRRIEELTGVPVVTLTYDGTGAPRNDLIIPYLRYPRKPSGRSGTTAPEAARSPSEPRDADTAAEAGSRAATPPPEGATAADGDPVFQRAVPRQ